MALILLIEDESLVRIPVSKALAGEGHEVLGASTGEEGLDLYQARNPDLVITDLNLPGISGQEVMALIRAGDRPGTLLIATTGGPGFAEVWKESGADAFLPKPFRLDQLCTMVDGLLEAK